MVAHLRTGIWILLALLASARVDFRMGSKKTWDSQQNRWVDSREKKLKRKLTTVFDCINPFQPTQGEFMTWGIKLFDDRNRIRELWVKRALAHCLMTPDITSCGLCLECSECSGIEYQILDKVEKPGGPSWEDYIESCRRGATLPQNLRDQLDKGAVFYDMRSDKSKPLEASTMLTINPNEGKKDMSGNSQPNFQWGWYERLFTMVKDHLRTLLSLVVLILICFRAPLFQCCLRVINELILICWHCRDLFRLIWETVEPTICILRDNNREIKGLRTELESARQQIVTRDQQIANLKESSERSKEVSRETATQHDQEISALQQDNAAQKFFIKKLREKPATAEIGVQPEHPDGWKPFELVQPELNRAYAQLREQTAEIREQAAEIQSLKDANTKLKAKKKSYNAKLKVANAKLKEKRLVSLQEDFGPGFDFSYAQVQAQFNLFQNRKPGEPSLALSVAPDPDFGEFDSE